MTPKQIREIAETMRDCGITHLKTSTLEMTCEVIKEVEVRHTSLPTEKITPKLENKSDEDPIKHKIETLSSLMKLSDHELVDSLFPDHTDQLDEDIA